MYTDYQQLEADYVAELVHPKDLKQAVGEAINNILEPVRQHFKSGKINNY